MQKLGSMVLPLPVAVLLLLLPMPPCCCFKPTYDQEVAHVKKLVEIFIFHQQERAE